jgi:hypothetical protein
MAYAGARVSKMAEPRFWVTTSLQTSTCLLSQATGEGDAGNLATLAYGHSPLWSLKKLKTGCG